MEYHIPNNEINNYNDDLLVLSLTYHHPSRQDTARQYIITPHIICNSEFYLVFISLLI